MFAGGSGNRHQGFMHKPSSAQSLSYTGCNDRFARFSTYVCKICKAVCALLCCMPRFDWSVPIICDDHLWLLKRWKNEKKEHMPNPSRIDVFRGRVKKAKRYPSVKAKIQEPRTRSSWGRGHPPPFEGFRGAGSSRRVPQPRRGKFFSEIPILAAS